MTGEHSYVTPPASCRKDVPVAILAGTDLELTPSRPYLHVTESAGIVQLSGGMWTVRFHPTPRDVAGRDSAATALVGAVR
ncbi:MAG TPA: hypothetical protein VFN10_19400 [Thermoanaerobaculia bacterium]|nr:hypothetical protein [Thermoanaerobaculia bacterium]